jgi:hypothetical protein
MGARRCLKFLGERSSIKMKRCLEMIKGAEKYLRILRKKVSKDVPILFLNGCSKTYKVGWANVKEFQTLSKKLIICSPKDPLPNFSLQLEVNLLESKLGLRSTMAMIYAVFPLVSSFDSSRFTSN